MKGSSTPSLQHSITPPGSSTSSLHPVSPLHHSITPSGPSTPSAFLSRFLLLLPLLLALACSGCSKAAKAKHYLALAQADFSSGEYQKAEIEYRKVLQVTPGNAEAIARLALIYQDQGRFPQALVLLKQAVELSPDDTNLRLKLSLSELSLGALKGAREDALGVLRKQPGQDDALLVLAESARSLKEAQDTIAELGKLRQQDTDKPGYHLALATLYLRLGQFTNVPPELSQALALDPKLPATHMAWGNLYWMSNNLAQADAEFKTGADLSPLRSSRRLKYAEFKLRTGAPDDAKKILEDLTQKVPDYLPAWNMLADLAFSQNRLDDAAVIVKKVLAQDAINYQASLLDARVKVTRNEVAQASEQLLRLSKVYDHSAEVLARLAECYLIDGEDAKAEATLKQALALDPNYPDAILALAQISIRKGDPVPAALSLEQLLRRRADLPQAHLLLAEAYVSQRNYDQALAVYQRMQSLFAKSPQVPFLMAQLLARMNRTDEARKACAQSLELAPDFLPPLEILVDLDVAAKKPQAALERLKQQLDRRPAVPELQLLVAKVYLDQKDFTSAEAALLKAVQLAPDLRTSYLMLAQLYIESNKTQQALDKLNSFVARTNDAPALMQIGMIQDSLKKYPEARDAYEKVLAVNPRFAAALNNLAYLYSEKFNQLDKAAQLAEQARRLYPADPSVNDTLGWVLFRKGELPRALSLITQAAAVAPNVAEIQCHLGMVRYSLGQEGPARLALQQALEGDKDFPGKEEAQRRLAILSIPPDASDPATQAKLEKQIVDDPADPVALVRLAGVFSRNGAPDKAVKTYGQALARNPKNAFILTSLAQLYSAPGSLNNPQKALEYAKDAHAAAPDDAATSQLLGHLVCQSGDYKWASSLLQEAALRNPDQPAILFDLARSYYGLGQLAPAERALTDALGSGTAFPQSDEAKRLLSLIIAYRDPAQRAAILPQLDSSLKADPNSIPLLMLSETQQQEKGSFPDAKKSLEQVLAQNPLFVPATRDLAILCFDHFTNDSRIPDLAAKAREAFPDDANLARLLGILAYRRGDFSSAARFLNQSVAGGSASAEVLYYLGMAQYRLKASADSKQSLKRALELNLPSQLADDAKRILAELK